MNCLQKRSDTKPLVTSWIRLLPSWQDINFSSLPHLCQRPTRDGRTFFTAGTVTVVNGHFIMFHLYNGVRDINKMWTEIFFFMNDQIFNYISWRVLMNKLSKLKKMIKLLRVDLNLSESSLVILCCMFPCYVKIRQGYWFRWYIYIYIYVYMWYIFILYYNTIQFLESALDCQT